MKVSRCRAFLLPIGLAVIVLTGLVGCAQKEEVDPYLYASLNDIMKGAVKDTISLNFTFEIEAPQFEFVRAQVGLVRAGNQLHFLVARDLENLYPRLAGTLLGVKQTFTPQPTHLVLERIKRGGIVEQDSMAAPDPYVLPRLLRGAAVDITEPGRGLVDVRWDRSRQTLDPLFPENPEDPLLRFQTGLENLVWAPRHDLDPEVRANPTEADMAFYAVMPDAAFQIVQLAPGADYMLHLLIEQDLPVVGSVTPVSQADFQQRRVEHEGIGHVVGELRINWFKYANTFVQGYREQL